MSKGILRSVLDYGGVAQVELISNLQRLIPARIEWGAPPDKRLFEFTVRYFQQRLEVPARQTLMDYFEAQKDEEVVEKVKDLDTISPYIRTNFSHLLATTVEQQNKFNAVKLFKEGQDIVTKGVIFDKEKKQGLRDGILHVQQNVHKLLIQDHTSRIQGNIRVDGEEVKAEYQMAKANKGLTWGKFCGLNSIDKVVKGVKKGELWLHAAYTGELKTTFALNWAYNLVTRYRSNVYYVTLEMPYEQIRQQIYVMHSSNGRFKEYARRVGLNPDMCNPLDYEKVKNGELSPEEEAFYNMVVDDFSTNPEYGTFDVWGPDTDVTIDDIRVQAEIAHNANPIDLLVIDHGGLVEPRRHKKGKDYVVELNSVLRDAKKLALQFNHGEKVPVLLLFQINRDGKDYADKMEGRYKLRALSYANEAERSADLVSTTYLNEDHRREGTAFFDCLKRRDGPMFQPFSAAIDWKTRRMSNLESLASRETGITVDDHRAVMNAIDQMFAAA